MMSRIATVAFVALFLGAAPADAPADPYQLVGFTPTNLLGHVGSFGFTNACQNHFGPTARWCTTQEVMETVVVPGGLTEPAWVRPDFPDHNLTVPGGVKHCNGWTQATSGGVPVDGLAVTPSGAFLLVACNVGHPVACCAPVPIP